VLEAEGIRPAFFAGTSIGGLVAALAARGVSAGQTLELARGFRFPRRFIPGRMLGWHEIFPTAVPLLEGLTFEDLGTPLAISAVDLQQGEEVVLHSGALLPAVRATCAVPGVVLPECIGGRFLIDWAVLNMLPVDLAWSWEPDVVSGECHVFAAAGGASGHRLRTGRDEAGTTGSEPPDRTPRFQYRHPGLRSRP
jgi:NTE family protein